jgi:MFS family permease
MSAAIIIGAQTAGRIVGRVGARRLLVVGMGLSAVGFALLTQLTATSSYVEGVLGGTLLITLGMGLSFTPLATAATAGVHWSQAGLASGVLNTSRQVGGSIGLAALATIATTRTTNLLGTSAITSETVSTAAGRSAVTSGFVLAFGVAAIVSAVAAIAALAIPETARRRQAPDAAVATAG